MGDTRVRVLGEGRKRFSGGREVWIVEEGWDSAAGDE